MLNSIYDLLNKDEMFLIRGGAQVPKPKSRPRDVFDDEDEVQSATIMQSAEELNLIDYIKFWFKNR